MQIQCLPVNVSRNTLSNRRLQDGDMFMALIKSVDKQIINNRRSIWS